jgi:hypothetical protein
VLGVNCGEDKASALAAMKSAGITWPNWHDGAPGKGAIANRYHVNSYPTIFAIDAQGNIRHKQILGRSLDLAVDALLRELEPKTSPPVHDNPR